MRLPLAAAGVLALLALTSPAAAAPDDTRAETYEAGCERLGLTLTLVAAREGPGAVARLAPGLPAELSAVLEGLHGSKGARDLRSFGQLDMQGTLVPALVDDTPGARVALDAFAADGGARLARDLSRVEADCRGLQGAAASLEQAVRAGEVRSRLVVGALEKGPALLRLAHQAHLLRHRCAEAEALADRYALLSRYFDRAPDPLVRAVLEALPRTVERAAAELAAVGSPGDLERTHRQAERRLASALGALGEAIDDASDAIRRVRDAELAGAVAGRRGSDMAQAVELFSSYKARFGAPPNLEATATWDVYEDRDTQILHFWLPGEGRWARGTDRLDPLEPVIAAFLAARDPALEQHVTRSRALERVYDAFPAAEPARSFAEGLAAVADRGAVVTGRLDRIARLAVDHGYDREAARDALARRTGGPLVLAGPAAGERVHDHLLRTAVERGPEAAVALAGAVDAAAARLEDLEVEAVLFGLRGPPGAEVDLVWSPDPAAGADFLLPPPDRAGLVAGGPTWVSVLAVGGAPVRCATYALHGGRVLTAQAGPREAATLAEAAGPALVRRVDPAQPDRLLVRQYPRGSVPLEPWIETAAGRRPLLPAPGGAWVDARPGEAGGAATVLGRTPEGAVGARFEVELPALTAVVLGDGSEPVPRVRPGDVVTGRVLAGERPSAGPHTYEVRAEGGALAARVEGGELEWAAEVPPGRYEVAVEGALPAPLAVTEREPRLVAVVDPHAAPVLEAAAPGQGLFLRLEGWPVVRADELIRVDWAVGGGTRTYQGSTRAVARAPQQAAVLPVRLSERARSGARRLKARLHLRRGTMEVEGAFVVREAAAERLEVGLWSRDGLPTEALALGGDPGAASVADEVQGATWVLVGPAGTTRVLASPFEKQAEVDLSEVDAPGRYAVWFHAWEAGVPREDAEAVFGVVAFEAYRPPPLALGFVGDPAAGATVAVEAVPPEGFEGPFAVQVGAGAWLDGLAAEVDVEPGARSTITLRDARGRRATGEVQLPE